MTLKIMMVVRKARIKIKEEVLTKGLPFFHRKKSKSAAAEMLHLKYYFDFL